MSKKKEFGIFRFSPDGLYPISKVIIRDFTDEKRARLKADFLRQKDALDGIISNYVVRPIDSKHAN